MHVLLKHPTSVLSHVNRSKVLQLQLFHTVADPPAADLLDMVSSAASCVVLMCSCVSEASCCLPAW